MLIAKFNILTDGDNSLKGKIAEAIFERVVLGSAKYKVFYRMFEKLQCCSTMELSWFLRNYGNVNVEAILNGVHKLLNYVDAELKRVISEYISVLNALREMLGLEKYGETKVDIETLKARIRSRDTCALCFRSINPYFHVRIYIYMPRRFLGLYTPYEIPVCVNCFKRMLEKGFVAPLHSTHSFYEGEIMRHFIVYGKSVYEIVVEDFYKAIANLANSIERLWEAIYRHNFSVAHVLSKLDEEAIEFLHKVYGGGGSGQKPFDYVCVDQNSCRYLVDVTAITLHHEEEVKPIRALSKREKEVAEEAKKLGFKILIPVIRFLENWTVGLELIEM
jgi:hypothetical protein